MERRQVTFRLTDDAREGWERICLAHGVTMTALIEAIGLDLYENGLPRDPSPLEMIDRARQIDLERRSRR